MADSTLAGSEVEKPAVSSPMEKDLHSFRASKRGLDIADWARTQFSKCKDAQLYQRGDWYLNLAYLENMQDAQVEVDGSRGLIKLMRPKNAAKREKGINRIRSYARTEHSKFISSFPTVVSVPSTGEESDQRAALAAQQVSESYFAAKQMRRQYGSAQWWRVALGNGFLKTWWDPSIKTMDGQEGDIAYANVTPFHLFVPNLREPELESQPYVIEAMVKPVEWVKQFYAEELKGENLTGTQAPQEGLFDDILVTAKGAPKTVDSAVIMEFWVKPGATSLLPQGALLIMVGEHIVYFHEGLPYEHGMYPYTKFDHVFTQAFYSVSPIADIIPMQREYNDLRTQVRTSARRMASPGWNVQEGSVDPNKMTNEPGIIRTYKMGFQPPQMDQPAQMPAYVSETLDRALTDIEDITGQHEVTKGQAPQGVTAGTALAFLKESDDNFLTPQHHNTEEAIEKVAIMTVSLFKQYVDVARKIRIVGADQSFDTVLLQGADVENGMDIRVEEGTSVGQSMAAKRAQVLDLVDRGLVDGPTALKLMEVGGVQRVLDIVSVAEKQAGRENIRMKNITEQEIQKQTAQIMERAQAIAAEQGVEWGPDAEEMVQAQAPSLIPVNDWDMHEVHIESHNKFRMSQEYESLPPYAQAEFDKHVRQHMVYAAQLMQNEAAMGGAVDPHGGEMPPEEGMPEDAGMGAMPEGGAVDPTMEMPPADSAPAALPPGGDFPVQ